ncbi:MAG: hypothetical protein HYT27_00895 [Parcubacteria group bacterium]|nr:hypothetical protein [Parcubacteria group bacterium]
MEVLMQWPKLPAPTFEEKGFITDRTDALVTDREDPFVQKAEGILTTMDDLPDFSPTPITPPKSAQLGYTDGFI